MLHSWLGRLAQVAHGRDARATVTWLGHLAHFANGQDARATVVRLGRLAYPPLPPLLRGESKGGLHGRDARATVMWLGHLAHFANGQDARATQF